MSNIFQIGTEIQAVSRAHRCGQTEQVRAVKLVLSGKGPTSSGKTIDQRVLEVQCSKRAIMADILEDEDILFNGNMLGVVEDKVNNQAPYFRNEMDSGQLSREEMMHLLS